MNKAELGKQKVYPPGTKKKCSYCLEEKLLEGFHALKGGKCGKNSRCKSCYKVLREKRLERKADAAILSSALKRCSKCGKKKHLYRFRFVKHGVLSRRSRCKKCESKARIRSKKGKERVLRFVKRTDGYKKCSRCEIKKERTEFDSRQNSRDGCRAICKYCRKETHDKYYNTIKGTISKVYTNSKQDARRRGIEYRLTPKHILDLYNKQNGRCAISGREMTVGNTGDKSEKGISVNNISLDRINSAREYTLDNVHLVCVIVNIMKFTLSTTELISLCYLVDTRNSRSKSFLSDVDDLAQYISKKFGIEESTVRNNIKDFVSRKYHSKDPKIKRYINRRYSLLRSSAKKRGIDVTVTLDDIFDLYERQQGRCKISNLKMICEIVDTKLHYGLSIDRIDSSKPYTKNNIQLLCSMFNIMKCSFSMTQFRDACSDILHYQDLKVGKLKLPKLVGSYYKLVNGEPKLV